MLVGYRTSVVGGLVVWVGWIAQVSDNRNSQVIISVNFGHLVGGHTIIRVFHFQKGSSSMFYRYL